MKEDKSVALLLSLYEGSNPAAVPVNDFYQSHMIEMNPKILELHTIRLFFCTAQTRSELKDLLRKYLSLLSAQRMRIGVHVMGAGGGGGGSSSSSGSSTMDSVQSHNNEEYQDKFDSHDDGAAHCLGYAEQKLNIVYYDQLRRIGESITASLQLLTAFNGSLTKIKSVNHRVREAFPNSLNDLSRIPEER